MVWQRAEAGVPRAGCLGRRQADRTGPMPPGKQRGRTREGNEYGVDDRLEQG